MKKYVYSLTVLFLVVSMLMSLASCSRADQIYVDKSQSYFSDYEVEDDKVFIKCHITIENTFKDEKVVTLSAILPEDVTNGLLKNETAKALKEDGSEMEFVLLPNTSNSFDVVFVGEYAGTNQKANRLLPEIDIEIVE
jgi:hypothetical protein